MPSQNASEEGFTVRDRRGRGAEPEPPPLPERGGPVRPESPPSPKSSGVVAPGASDLPPEPDLASLFLLLANSALLHLGEEPEAAAAAPMDLAQAKFSIDLLRLLRDRTEGHRSPDESQLLDEILYDLELRFVRVAGSR